MILRGGLPAVSNKNRRDQLEEFEYLGRVVESAALEGPTCASVEGSRTCVVPLCLIGLGGTFNAHDALPHSGNGFPWL